MGVYFLSIQYAPFNQIKGMSDYVQSKVAHDFKPNEAKKYCHRDLHYDYDYNYDGDYDDDDVRRSDT